VALLAGAIQGEPEPSAALRESLDVIVRQTAAVDAALAEHAGGRLVVDRSLRGRLGPGAATVAAHPPLARALRDGEPLWLDDAARAALGVPEDLRACAAPVVVAAEPLGVLVLGAEAVETLDADARRLLRAVAGTVGFALLRDRLVAELRTARR